VEAATIGMPAKVKPIAANSAREGLPKMHTPIVDLAKPVKVQSGRKLSCRLRGSTVHQKAAIAVELMEGATAVKQLTAKQAAVITGAKPFHITTRRKRAAGIPVVVRDRGDVVDRLIDRIYKLGGADRLLERLEELTAPTAVKEATVPVMVTAG
jgi:hypothetical protein